MGVPTTEGIHTWDADGDNIVFNDREDLDLSTRRYRYWCSSIDLRGLPEPQLPADQVVGGLGTIARPGARGGKNVTYEGWVEAVSDIDLREATDLLEAAFLELDDERRMDITYHADHPSHADAYYFNGRGTVVVKDDPGGVYGYRSSFVLTLQLGDPRIYLADVVEELLMSPREGTPLSWVLPVAIGGSAGPLLTLTNPGRVRSPFVIDFYGPWTTPTVLDVDRGVQLILDYTPDEDRFVRVDFRQGIVLTDDGEDISWAVRWPDSTWWDNRYRHLPKGASTLHFGGGASGPARAEVTVSPAVA
jgi:hypothetical protein